MFKSETRIAGFSSFCPFDEYPNILQCEWEVAPPSTVLDNLNLFLYVIISSNPQVPREGAVRITLFYY